MLPLTYHIEGQDYSDDVLAPQMTSAQFYDKVRGGSMPTTSQITPEVFKARIGPMLAAGDDVLYLAFSSGLSGTYNASRVAFDDLREEYPGRTLITVDTLAASMGEEMCIRDRLCLLPARRVSCGRLQRCAGKPVPGSLTLALSLIHILPSRTAGAP